MTGTEKQPKREHTGLRTFEIVQYVDGYIEGTFNDWPANIQDAIFAALEWKSKQVGLPLAIVSSKCDHDPDIDDTAHPRKFWLHIVASEVVMADDRTIEPWRLT